MIFDGTNGFLFAHQVHPMIHEAILETARLESIVPKDAHETFTAHQAVYLVRNMLASLSLQSLHPSIAVFEELRSGV